MDDWNKFAKTITDSLVAPIINRFKNFSISEYADLLNSPQDKIRSALTNKLNLKDLNIVQIITAIRASGSQPIESILDNYLERIDNIEWALSSLIGKKLPIVEAISSDLHQLLEKSETNNIFPTSLLALLDEVSNIYKSLLTELNIIVGEKNKITLGKVKYGNFYDWINCNTEIDKHHKHLSAENKKRQQRLRYTMMKVILSYVDDIDVNPVCFKSITKSELEKDLEILLAQTRTSLSSISGLSNGILNNRVMKSYAGLVAAAFEHIFISSKQGLSQKNDATDHPYHELPLTLKLQSPKLFKTSISKRGIATFSDISLETDSELLAMKLAKSKANYTSDLIYTAIVCVGNGIWEISPNNPPLVETIASFISILVYEFEKSITYDLLRRFRIYVTDKPVDSTNECILLVASIQVPDFSESQTTEKAIKAIIALQHDDDQLLAAIKSIFGELPINLDSDDIATLDNAFADMLHGTLKDAIAFSAITFN